MQAVKFVKFFTNLTIFDKTIYLRNLFLFRKTPILLYHLNY
ncbi:hypothetical protein MHA_1621 [Mannheimia haemolytica PHL213]|nr:hypothetical protein MHH_c25140 [Mannheimia haemolytica M42548]EDN74537.1 hypothetical protein MHA_1621 [Mannheimia haemolytica PHL213]